MAGGISAIGGLGGGFDPMALVGGVQNGLGGGGTTKLGGLDGGSGGDGVGSVAGSGGGGHNFASVLSSKLAELNTQQADSNTASQQMATGKVDDVAQTMLRIEQANISLQMATQVRNKAMDAYQEVLRMQV